MRLKFIPLIPLVLLIAGYALIFPFIERYRSPVKTVETQGLILPPLVMKILTGEFKSVTADFLFVRASQYFGGKIENREQADRSDMVWLYRNLIVITELDPYFEDPYYFGNALLTWDVGMVKEADILLQKATNARTWDWQFPFYLGFNKFYFLKDNKAGADYLLIAAKRPGAPTFLPTLAARLYSNAGRTENAIAFLITFWENERDERAKKSYEIRIDALKKILFLEYAVTRYKKKTGRHPKNLEALIQAGIIEKIPQDPYGGVFYIAKDGSIQTTSKLAFLPKTQRQRNK